MYVECLLFVIICYAGLIVSWWPVLDIILWAFLLVNSNCNTEIEVTLEYGVSSDFLKPI